ncbi:MAG: hypothetical protein K2Q01_12070 [Rickettsiales bacterium]|nr:hypothetical protein [Rickettsiales bacterium]
MQIIILGMHRSGTSMVTRLINLMGAYFGPEGSVGELTHDNPKGFWERPEIFKLNESLLAARGGSWQDLRGFTPSEAGRAPDKAIKNIKKIILGMDAFRPWVLKDPRMCLLLPAWLPHLEAPIAVIVHRNAGEIAASLHTRDGLSPEYSLALWEAYSVTALNASLKIPRLFVRHADLMEKPFKTAETLFTQLRELGVRRIEMPSEREIRGFIDTRLHRSHGKLALTPHQQEIEAMLQGKTPQKTLLKISDASKALLSQGPQPRKDSA